MKNLTLIAITALLLGSHALIAAPAPRAAVTSISTDGGLIVKSAYHRHKNMTRVHKGVNSNTKYYRSQGLTK